MRLFHQAYKGRILQRLNEEEVFIALQRAAKHLVNSLMHMAVWMQGINKIHFCIFLRELLYGLADMFKSFAEVLPSVTGYQNESATFVQPLHIVAGRSQQACLFFGQRGIFLHLFQDGMQCVDNRIPRHHHLARHLFSFQVFSCQSCRSEMIGSHATRQLPVHFLRPRCLRAIGAQACLHVSYRNMVVESR